MTRTWVSGLGCASAILLTACPERSAIWILDGEVPARPVFGIGRTQDGATFDGLTDLLVARCEEFDGTAAHALWVVARAQQGPAPRQVSYGEAPRGFVVTKSGPERLAPGCYVASITGAGRLRFTVRPDRTSRAIGGGEQR